MNAPRHGDDSIISAPNDENTLLKVKTSLIEGAIYTYAEMCAAFGDKELKGGWQRKAQRKEWRRFIDWDNPTSRQYRIVRIFDVPDAKKDGRKGNGGKRKGAGAKAKHREEFDCLLSAFCGIWESRSMYNGEQMDEIYFSATDLGKYFGIITDGILELDNHVNDLMQHMSENSKMVIDVSEAGNAVYAKLREKTQTVLKRIAKIDGVTLEQGMLAYKDTTPNGIDILKEEYEQLGWVWPNDPGHLNIPDRRNDLLPQWNSLCERYLRERGLKNLGEVVELGLWNNMVDSISSHFPGYSKIIRVHKLRVANEHAGDKRLLSEVIRGEYDIDKVKVVREKFNSFICDDISEYFMGKEDNALTYLMVIEKYVRLGKDKEPNLTYAKELMASPEIERELVSSLGCTEVALRCHIDWLDRSPRDLLDKIRSLQNVSLMQNAYVKQGNSKYWQDLKRILRNEPIRGIFPKQVPDEVEARPVDPTTLDMRYMMGWA